MPVRIYDISKKLGLENKEVSPRPSRWALPLPKSRPVRSIKSLLNISKISFAQNILSSPHRRLLRHRHRHRPSNRSSSSSHRLEAETSSRAGNGSDRRCRRTASSSGNDFSSTGCRRVARTAAASPCPASAASSRSKARRKSRLHPTAAVVRCLESATRPARSNFRPHVLLRR